MSKPYLVPQIYGYIICLIAVVTLLFSLAPLIQSIIDLNDIEYSGQYYPSSQSFGQFRLRALERTPGKNVIPDDSALRRLYDDDRREAYKRAYIKIRDTIVVKTLMLVVSIILFISHWKWIKRIKAEAL